MNNVSADYFLFVDFEQSLEGLSAEDLMKTMRAFLSKGIITCQKGFERAAAEAKTSLEEKRLLEDESRRLREENEKLKQESRQLADQRAKLRDAMDALKKELESCLICYEECRTKLKDMVTQYDAQKILLEANANLIAELKRMKGELEDTLEKNEAYCHKWGAYLATAYRRALESFGAEAQDFKITDNISSFVEWLHSELKLLPDTMSKIGDYGAATYSEMLLHLLER
jgi:DNA repair exonuclease SbcCD ATPase subunit